ncbi:MAG: DUF2752 domain-containing protein [Clostridia bacterium]|nr:DUF2752 domain-containing protein [Clostridia bacterium]
MKTEQEAVRKQWKQAAALNLSALAAALVYMAIMVRTEIFCPIRHLTGIPCAGCGMSRALGCLLRGNFAGSLRCNPALLPCLMAAFVLLNRETVVLARWDRRVKDAVIAAGFGFTLAVYVVRLLFFEIP